MKIWGHVVCRVSNVEQETRVTAASEGGKYLRQIKGRRIKRLKILNWEKENAGCSWTSIPSLCNVWNCKILWNLTGLNKKYHQFQFWAPGLQSAHFTRLLIEHIYCMKSMTQQWPCMEYTTQILSMSLPLNAGWRKYSETCTYKQKENFVQNHWLDCLIFEMPPWVGGRRSFQGTRQLFPCKGARSSSAAPLPRGTESRTAPSLATHGQQAVCSLRARPSCCSLLLWRVCVCVPWL